MQLVEDLSVFTVLCNTSGNFKSCSTGTEWYCDDGSFEHIGPSQALYTTLKMASSNARYKRNISEVEVDNTGPGKGSYLRAVAMCQFGPLASRKDFRIVVPSCAWLSMAQYVIEPLECLNKSLQPASMTIAGTLQRRTFFLRPRGAQLLSFFSFLPALLSSNKPVAKVWGSQDNLDTAGFTP